MKKFLSKLLALSLIMLLIVGLIWSISIFGLKNVYKNNYQRGYEYQYLALKNSDPNVQKVIVIGGSYMTFATDSEQLSNLIGKPVYTLGIHSGMGMDYIMESALRFANEGDIIVFSFLPFTADYYGMDLIQISLDGNFEMYTDFLKIHPDEILKSEGSKIFKKTWNLLMNLKKYGTEESDPLQATSVYDARAFSQESGNLIYERPVSIAEDADLFGNNELNDSYLGTECINSVNEFKHKCDLKGVNTYLIYSPFFYGYYPNFSESNVTDLQNKIENTIEIPLIADIDECAVNRDYTYNGALHMNDLGKNYYTNLIYESLINYIK